MHQSTQNKHKQQIGINDALNKLRDVMLYDTSVQQNPTPPTTISMQQNLKPTPPPPPPTPRPMQSMQSMQPNPKPKPIQSNENVFRPALNQDPLFWCLYVMMNGTFKYEQLANRFTAEQDGKRDQIIMLRDKAKPLKQSTGIKFSVSSIEGEIISPRISLHAFQVLVHLNSLNAVFVNPANRVYAEFISDAVSDKPVYVIERTPRVTMTQVTEAQLASVRTSNYRIDNLHKPIKSMSAYTVTELTEMCHQLKIQLKPKMKKQELYDAVSSQLVL